MAEEDFNAGEAPDPTQGIKDAALGQMARDENPENYIKEREARDAESRGEEADEDARSERIRQALEKAREDTEAARNGIGEPKPDLDSELQAAEAQWQEEIQQEQTFEQERDVARNEGRFQAIAEQLKQSNPQTWQQITDNLQVFDTMATPEQGEAFKRALIAGSPQEGLAIVHRLSQPTFGPDGSLQMSAQDKIAHIVSLPPQEITRVVNQARDWLQIEHNVSKNTPLHGLHKASVIPQPRRRSLGLEVEQTRRRTWKGSQPKERLPRTTFALDSSK